MIGDSSAEVSDAIRSQHQAALTVLGRSLFSHVGPFHWLDLASGRGQIINQLASNVPHVAERARIQHTYYDAERVFLEETRLKAEALGFMGHRAKVGDISDAAKLLEEFAPFDFITFTNAVHELDPFRVPTLLVSMLQLLSPTGTLYAYDMEALPPNSLELGAVLWNQQDISELVRDLHEFAGLYNCPMTQRWTHSRTSGWSLDLQRNWFKADLSGLNDHVDTSSAKLVRRILGRKLEETRVSLEALTAAGTQTTEDREEGLTQLYNHWSISRALSRGAK